jgi:TrmH family RNA methyltransferase
MNERISSAANPLVKRIRLLADRKHRQREGAFVVEGIQPVWRAIEAGRQIEVLIVAPELLAGPAAAAMVAEQEAKGVRVARLSPEMFLRLSDRDGPSGLAAIVAGRQAGLRDLVVRPGSVFAALHRIGNPGNLGTIIRTVDAAGGAGVILIGDTADPFAPAAVKASMGSLFAVEVARVPGAGTFFDWAAANGIQVVATSGRAGRDHWSTRYHPPLAILLGSEGDGLPDDLLARADQRIRIPMTGTAESLNLAAAAAVLLYEVRRHAIGPPGGRPGP